MVFDQIRIVESDITTLAVDAIVNAANNALMGGGGVDGAIHRAAGPELKEACRSFGGCPTGEARITSGFQLIAKYVIHAVGPVWNNDTQGESDLLRSAYLNSLEFTKTRDIRSIAFPSISTGAYRFPFHMATQIAIKTCFNFLKQHNRPKEILLVAYSTKDYDRMTKILERMKANNRLTSR